MSAKLMIERDGFDLREAMDWCDWLEYLSFEDREVFEQACVHYVCAEDALVLLFSLTKLTSKSGMMVSPELYKASAIFTKKGGRTG